MDKVQPKLEQQVQQQETANLQSLRRQAERLQYTRNQPAPSPLLGFSYFGIIGWSIALPSVLGAFLGQFLNQVAPQRFSWVVALILGGLVIGVFLAWSYIASAQKAARVQAAASESIDTDNPLPAKPLAAKPPATSNHTEN